MKGSSNGQFSYASSKAASTHLSRMLATTFKDVKVRVNVIAPGVFPSEMTAGKSGEDVRIPLLPLRKMAADLINLSRTNQRDTWT